MKLLSVYIDKYKNLSGNYDFTSQDGYIALIGENGNSSLTASVIPSRLEITPSLTPSLTPPLTRAYALIGSIF